MKIRFIDRAKRSFLINLVFVLILPTILGFTLLEDTLLSINFMILLIINGSLVTIMAFFNAKLEPFFGYKLFLLISLQVLTILQFLILLPSEVIIYTTPSLIFYIDLRVPYMFLLGVPVLITILNFFKFYIKRRDMKIKLILLYTINSYNLSKKKINIRKYFSEYIDLDKVLKKQILSAFNSHLLELRKNSRNTLVQKKNDMLKLSDTGKKIIERRNINKMLKSIIINYYSPSVEGYDVWNERDLKLYNFKRKLINIIKKE